MPIMLDVSPVAFKRTWMDDRSCSYVNCTYSSLVKSSWRRRFHIEEHRQVLKCFQCSCHGNYGVESPTGAAPGDGAGVQSPAIGVDNPRKEDMVLSNSTVAILLLLMLLLLGVLIVGLLLSMLMKQSGSKRNKR